MQSRAQYPGCSVVLCSDTKIGTGVVRFILCKTVPGTRVAQLLCDANNTKFRTRAMCMVLCELGPIPDLLGYAVGREVLALYQSR